MISRGGAAVEDLVALFNTTSIAEMATYAQIASERVKSIRELEAAMSQEAPELEFQKLIAGAPWLIEPTWSVISQNQALKTFKQQFELFWESKCGESITFAIDSRFKSKRPDFVLISVGRKLHIVEIKKPKHNFDDNDFDRLINYVYGFREFFSSHEQVASEFPEGWQIDLVADDVKLSGLSSKESFEGFETHGEVVRMTWVDFLMRAKIAHEKFLETREQFQMGID